MSEESPPGAKCIGWPCAAFHLDWLSQRGIPKPVNRRQPNIPCSRALFQLHLVSMQLGGAKPATQMPSDLAQSMPNRFGVLCKSWSGSLVSTCVV